MNRDVNVDFLAHEYARLGVPPERLEASWFPRDLSRKVREIQEENSERTGHE